MKLYSRRSTAIFATAVVLTLGSAAQALPWIPRSGQNFGWQPNTAGPWVTPTASYPGTPGVDQEFRMTTEVPIGDFPGPGLLRNAGPFVQPFGTPGSINQFGTPWVKVTFIDSWNPNGSFPRFQIFVNGPASMNAGNPQGAQVVLTAGAAQQNNTNSGTGGWADENGNLLPNGEQIGPYNTPGTDGFTASDVGALNFMGEATWGGWGGNNKQVISFATKDGSGIVANADQADWGIPEADRAERRGEGIEVTLMIGKLADDTIEFFVYDGQRSYYWQNEVFKNLGFSFDFQQVEVGTVGFGQGATAGSPQTVVFTNFEFGNGYVSRAIPEPASLGLMVLGSTLMLARRRKA